MANRLGKPAKVDMLANWYFGNFCAKCTKVEDENENYGKECYDKIHAIKDKLKEGGIELMTHKEFTVLIKTTPFCKPIKRAFPECPICKALGVLQKRY